MALPTLTTRWQSPPTPCWPQTTWNLKQPCLGVVAGQQSLPVFQNCPEASLINSVAPKEKLRCPEMGGGFPEEEVLGVHEQRICFSPVLFETADPSSVESRWARFSWHSVLSPPPPLLPRPHSEMAAELSFNSVRGPRRSPFYGCCHLYVVGGHLNGPRIPPLL